MNCIINIKPLSVNEAWQGKRFKTQKYKDYELELYYQLPVAEIITNKPLELEIEVGFSNRASDLSNIIKPLEDILCKKYNIDDRWNYKIVMSKKIVKKGKEYIKIDIKDLDISI